MRTLRHSMADLDSSAGQDVVPLGNDADRFLYVHLSHWLARCVRYLSLMVQMYFRLREHPCKISFGEISTFNEDTSAIINFIQKLL